MNEQPTDSIIQALIKDRKRDRFWRNIRFGTGLLVLLIFTLCLVGIVAAGNNDEDHVDRNKPYVNVVKLEGEVATEAPFSAQRTIPQIQKAFKDKKAHAVILLIDSPGGSPVNASQIYHEILRQKKGHPKIPVIAIGQDMLTSAAYLVAAAADFIYVDDNTITGSIGVISSGFGFNNAISKVGIERRVFSSGAHKGRLDPFKPLETIDQEKMQKTLRTVHDNFINYVKATRSKKLNGSDDEIFSGDFWTGKEALKLGLVDGIADLEDILEKFHVDQYQCYSPKQSFLRQILHDVGEETQLRLQNSHNRLQAKF